MTAADINLAFVGLDTQYPCADGQTRRRVHLDGAASPLAAQAGMEMLAKLLPHYSNTHSYVHSSAKVASKAYQWAHQQVLEFVGASEDEYACVFLGSGSTAAINRLARGLHQMRSERPMVGISAMEHHANDLPHRQFKNQCLYLPLTGEGSELGAIDLAKLERICDKHAEQLNYLALSAVSNVTGIRNPLAEVVDIAHRHNILVVVDAAQSVAHIPSELDNVQADFWIFSGHKLYTPTAPGVMVARRALLETMPGQDLGGGSVTDVSFYDYQLHQDVSVKEESGTPNIIGAVALGGTISALSKISWQTLRAREMSLMAQLIEGLSNQSKIQIYGDFSLTRIAALAFNHTDIEHGLLAAILNDYYGIAVRNECFCAHPYVSSLLKEELWEIDLAGVKEQDHQALINSRRGMVRVSLSAYNTAEDIMNLLQAIRDIELNIDELRALYQLHEDGSFSHTQFSIEWQHHLTV